MKTKKPELIMEDIRIDVKIKLAALWVTINLLYLYVGVYSFYRLGILEKITGGEVAFT